MKATWLLLGLALSAAAWAGDPSNATHIRAGRAALESGHPVAARAEFRAAVGTSLVPGDRFAALVGLGRAELWLGHYRAALDAFSEARRFAVSVEDRHVVDTGAARALNALEYHLHAYALVAPFASGNPVATLELARAAIALGRADEASRVISDEPAPDPSTRTGVDLLQAKSQIDYEIAARGEGGFSFTHDSDGMTVRTYAVAAFLPMAPGDATFNTWRITAATSDVASGPGQSDRLTEASVGDELGIGNRQHLEVRAGVGSAAGRSLLEGSVQWEDQLEDAASVFGSAERSPIVTPTALASALLYSTFSLGTSLRAADHWMVVPVYFHQVFSDGNQRDGGRLKIVLTPFDIPGSASALGANVEVRAYRSTQPSGGTYFNPAQYHQEQFGLIGLHQFGIRWRMRVTTGIGSETVDGASAKTWWWALSLTGRLPGNGRLELHAGRDSFASLAGGGSGYWTNGASLTAAWPLSSR